MRDRVATLSAYLRPPLLAAAAFVLVVAYFGMHEVRPFLTVKRGVRAATAVPPALFNLHQLALPGGSEACLNDVTLPPDGEQAVFVAQANGRPGPELTIAAAGPGYRFRTSVPRGWGGGALTVPMRPPAHSLRGTFCVRNHGRRPILFNATDTPARPAMTVNGVVTPEQMALEFDRASAQSLGARLPEIFAHAASFTWPGRLVLYLLALALALGLPVAIGYLLASALEADDLFGTGALRARVGTWLTRGSGGRGLRGRVTAATEPVRLLHEHLVDMLAPPPHLMNPTDSFEPLDPQAITDERARIARSALIRHGIGAEPPLRAARGEVVLRPTKRYALQGAIAPAAVLALACGASYWAYAPAFLVAGGLAALLIMRHWHLLERFVPAWVPRGRSFGLVAVTPLLLIAFIAVALLHAA